MDFFEFVIAFKKWLFYSFTLSSYKLCVKCVVQNSKQRAGFTSLVQSVRTQSTLPYSLSYFHVSSPLRNIRISKESRTKFLQPAPPRLSGQKNGCNFFLNIFFPEWTTLYPLPLSELSTKKKFLRLGPAFKEKSC